MKFGLTQRDLDKILAVLANDSAVEKAILYGSRAKGTHKPGSDIDLTLVGENLELHQLNKIANQLDDLLLPYTFDLSIFHHIDNKDLLEHIDRVGLVFFVR